MIPYQIAESADIQVQSTRHFFLGQPFRGDSCWQTWNERRLFLRRLDGRRSDQGSGCVRFASHPEIYAKARASCHNKKASGGTFFEALALNVSIRRRYCRQKGQFLGKNAFKSVFIRTNRRREKRPAFGA